MESAKRYESVQVWRGYRNLGVIHLGSSMPDLFPSTGLGKDYGFALHGLNIRKSGVIPSKKAGVLSIKNKKQFI